MHRSAALLLLLTAAAGLMRAQAGETFEVRGTVVEPGSDGGAALPIQGVEVMLSEFILVENVVTPSLVGTVYTDPQGAYRFHPQRAGAYYVEVKKEGYSGLAGSGPTDFTGSSVAVDPAHPVQENTFQLARRGEIRGRVVDEDGQPVAGLAVVVQPNGPGAAANFLEITVVTGPDGAFAAINLIPGPHTVRISPRSGSLEKLVPQYSEDDFKIVDQDVETSYWPGGSSAPSTSIPVSPGASASAGTIKVRQASYYRAHVSVPHVKCGAAEVWSFWVVDARGVPLGIRDKGYPELPCTSDFLVTNLRPGSYWFVLNQTRTAPGRWAIAPVEISSRNVEVGLTLTQDSEITGRIVPAEGATLPPLNRVRLSARPDSVGFPRSPLMPPPDAEGKFALKNLKSSRNKILVDGLTSQYYVKEIRLNGAPSPDGFVSLNPGAENQLEIVLDDKAGAITGTVTNGDKPAADAVVRLFSQAMQDGPFARVADKDGRFQFAGLTPGEYRAVAVPSVADWPADKDAMDRMVARAEAIVIERGGSRDISVKLTAPSH